MKKCAIVCARGLGDALLSMILTHNLTLSGYDVTTFSTILCELRDWFPGQKISPYPHDFSTLSSFDRIYAADHSGFNGTHPLGKKLIVLKEENFNKTQSMVFNLKDFCQNSIDLPSALDFNGITIPSHLKHHAFPKRVIIHPLSGDEKKNWPMKKFLKLSNRLFKLGYHPAICMSPKEREIWSDQIQQYCYIDFPLFPTVSELAAFIYESGCMIGNDSGVGHLASCLGIPTLSLFARKNYSRLWRPGWGKNQVVAPPSLLFGASLKQQYWKRLLTVSKVLATFRAI